MKFKILGVSTGVSFIALFGAALTVDAAPIPTAVPDFSSNQAAWIAAGNDFIPVPGRPKPVSYDPKYPYVPNNLLRQPTFRISDLTNPNVKPWANEAMKKENEKVLAGKIAFTPRSSCLPAGVPGFMMFVVDPVFIIQSPKEVLFISSGNNEVRHVYLEVPHSTNVRPSWYGESIGHYDGDFLVIDTIGFNDKTFIDNYRTPHTEKLHVTERWGLIEQGRVLEVNFTVEDADTYYQPWSGIQRYRRVEDRIGEQVCAENNLQSSDYKTPVADKPEF
jgi:hypothetical protein